MKNTSKNTRKYKVIPKPNLILFFSQKRIHIKKIQRIFMI